MALWVERTACARTQGHKLPQGIGERNVVYWEDMEMSQKR